MKAEYLSKYIIAYLNNKGYDVTNSMLQRLLYYIEAWGQVYFDGIIDDDFEAWGSGPLIYNIMKKYNSFGVKPIDQKYEKEETAFSFIKKFRDEFGKDKISKDKIEMIEVVLRRYGVNSPLALEMLSQSQEPWKEARKGCGPLDECRNIISKEKMKTYYSSLIK